MASAAKTRRLKRMKTEIGMGAVRPPGEGVSAEEADRLADEYRPSWEMDEPDDESGVSAVAAPEVVDSTPTGPATPVAIAPPATPPSAPPRPAAAVAIHDPPPRLVSAKATLPLGVAAPSDAELRAALAGTERPPVPSAAVAPPMAAPVAPPVPEARRVPSAPPSPPPPTPAIHDDLEDTGRLRALAAKSGGSGMRGSVIIAGSAIIALGIVVSTYLITRRPDAPVEPTPDTSTTAAVTPTVGSDHVGTGTTPAPSAAALPDPAPAPTPAEVPPAAPAADPAAAVAAATPTAPGATTEPAPAPEAPPTPAPVVPDPPMTRVRLSTSPPGATLTIDGVTVINPYEARVSRDGRAHEIGATLDGHDAATRSVTFDREELSLRLTLRRTPPPPEPVAERPPVAATRPVVAASRPAVARPSRPAVDRPSRPIAERPSRPATPRRPTKRGAGFVTTNPY